MLTREELSHYKDISPSWNKELIGKKQAIPKTPHPLDSILAKIIKVLTTSLVFGIGKEIICKNHKLIIVHVALLGNMRNISAHHSRKKSLFYGPKLVV